jgi:hypothetical protein
MISLSIRSEAQALFFTALNKTPAKVFKAGVFISGGETGIRTPVSFNPEHAFQACDLNHSSISPLFKHLL